jgi:hypothetical protein
MGVARAWSLLSHFGKQGVFTMKFMTMLPTLMTNPANCDDFPLERLLHPRHFPAKHLKMATVTLIARATAKVSALGSTRKCTMEAVLR